MNKLLVLGLLGLLMFGVYAVISAPTVSALDTLSICSGLFYRGWDVHYSNGPLVGGEGAYCIDYIHNYYSGVRL